MHSINQIQNNSHILGIYSSPQRKIEEGLEYLRIGFEEKNEAILIVTDELSKEEIRDEIIKKWKVFSADEMKKQERNGIINIKSSSNLYFSTNIINREKIFKQYFDITNKAIEKGKRGLRVFVDMRIFFERKYIKYVIEFEKSLPPSYDFPLTFICAYDLDDFKKLDQQSRNILFDHHNLYLINNLNRNIFDDSSSLLGLNAHICMYYEKEFQSTSIFIPNSLLRFIGEGIKKDHLCVYISMYNLEKNHPKIILSQIPNLKKNQEKNFLAIKNSDNYYINAACENLQPFEDLKKLIFEEATLNNKRGIRIITDIPNFLFKNKHFDQCIALEEWWDQTIEDLNKRHGIGILLLCLYNCNYFHNSSFKYHRHRINDNHSIVCDSDGIIQSKNYNLYSCIKKEKSENREG